MPGVPVVDGATDSVSDVLAVLVGLPPVYAHGLRHGLVAADVRCTSVSAAVDLPPLLGADPCVAVVLESEAPALTALGLRGDDRLETVHVLEQDSLQAWTDALRAGATGAFATDAELDQIVRVVRSAAAGQTLLPLRVARALGRGRSGPPPRLERTERQYLRRLADGGTVAGLARASGWSEREMYRLLSALYVRLGATNRTEALLLAERWGLLDEEAR